MSEQIDQYFIKIRRYRDGNDFCPQWFKTGYASKAKCEKLIKDLREMCSGDSLTQIDLQVDWKYSD